MKIIVDANIVFSAIINSEGKIGQILIMGSKNFEFFSVGLLKEEIIRHKNKILTFSGLSKSQLEKSYLSITSRIKFIDEILLSDKEVSVAFKLMKDIDENDTLYVALTNYLNGKLWTGDKRLITGLNKKGYTNIITTNDLYKLFSETQIIVKK